MSGLMCRAEGCVKPVMLDIGDGTRCPRHELIAEVAAVLGRSPGFYQSYGRERIAEFLVDELEELSDALREREAVGW